jgi:hypothetical protein
VRGRGARRALAAAFQAERRVTSPLRGLRRRAWEEGVLGGDTKWMAVGAVVGGLWLVQWAWRREAEVVYRTQLKPGETLVIDTARPAS